MIQWILLLFFHILQFLCLRKFILPTIATLYFKSSKQCDRNASGDWWDNDFSLIANPQSSLAELFWYTQAWTNEIVEFRKEDAWHYLFLCQFTFAPENTVSHWVFFYCLIPKRHFSMVNIAHVISQRLCHCNFQSLCVVKTSVRITNTHPKIAILS